MREINQALETYNYWHDPRTLKTVVPPTVVVDDGEGWETVVSLPAKWVVCDVCDGKGTVVNPSIDCGGLTGEDFADDPDFANDYMSGVYDQPCNRCQGRTTISVVDRDRCDADLLAAYDEAVKDEADAEAAQRAELAMGC